MHTAIYTVLIVIHAEDYIYYIIAMMHMQTLKEARCYMQRE